MSRTSYKPSEYQGFGLRGGVQQTKDYSPYHQQTQRPNSAGVIRGRSSNSGGISGHGNAGSGLNYARNVSGNAGGNVRNGAVAPNIYLDGNNPIISAGLLGTGFPSQRPSSAGHVRPAASASSGANGGVMGNSGSSNAQSAHVPIPILPPQSQGQPPAGYTRPKSAGAVRRPENPMNILGTNNVMSQPNMYYQGQPDKSSTSGNAGVNNVRQSAPQGVGGGNDHWSTSYKLHYGYAGASGTMTPGSGMHMGTPSTGMNANSMNSSTGGMQMSSGGIAMGAGGVAERTNGAPVNAPSQQRPSSATARIRTAIDHSHKYAIQTDSTNGAPTNKELQVEGDADMGLDVEANRELLRDDDDEMDGKPLGDSRSHPEVSTTTPSQSLELGANSVGVDIRNGSLDSLTEEIVDIGITTVPNQFCSVRDALELKKLLLMSKGSRGGIVPSSTAVMDMYMVGKVVGVGSYGKVRAAWHRLTGSKVAIKTYDKSKLKDPAHWKRVHSEIKIMEQVSHPRIARMYEAVETPKRMHLIMECLDGGNLCSYVKAKRRLTEDESRRIFFQIMQAIEHLHLLGVTHRDVKLENVLFADNKDVKLIDFGFSTVCQAGKRLKVFCGTPSYMAPEIVRRTEYEGKPVDMWSLGILLYALLCGCFPFRAKSYPDLYRRIARGTFAIPEELSAPVKDLLRQLLTVDVSQRATAQQAIRHSWLQSQFATAPDINKMRLETPILISDKPSDDIDEQCLSELEQFGMGRDEVIRLVLTKTHSSVATLYYLLLDILVTKRRMLGKSRGSSSHSSSKNRVTSTGGSGGGVLGGIPLSTTHGGSSSNGQAQSRSTQAEVMAALYMQQQQQQQQQQQGARGANDSYSLLRPKSASAGRPSNSGHQRPLSAFAGRR